MRKMFEVPEVGKLVLEHTFYEFGCDLILFVCTDIKGTRYLCSCYHLGQNWVIGQVGEKILIDLIDDKITIHEVFERHCHPKWDVSWNGEVYSYSATVSDDVLPEKGALLELEPKQTEQYRKILLQLLQTESW